MKFSIFCTIVAILGVFYTLIFLIIPADAANNYGVHLDAGGVSLARLFAGALGSLTIVTWVVRNQDPASTGARAAIWGGIFFQLVSVVSTTCNIVNGVVNSLGWSSVALSALILIGSLYFLSKKRAFA